MKLRDAYKYYLRNRRQAAIVLTIVALAIFAITIMVVLTDAVSINLAVPHRRLERWTEVTVDNEIAEQVSEQLIALDTVSDVIPARLTSIWYPTFMSNIGFNTFGLYQDDMQRLLRASGARVVQGRLPQPGTTEIALSERIVRANGLKLGDTIEQPEVRGPSVERKPAFTVVGILSPDPALALVPREPLEAAGPTIQVLIAIPGHAGRTAMNGQMQPALEGIGMKADTLMLKTWEDIVISANREFQRVLFILALIEAVTISVIALAIGVLNYLFFQQRLEEYGLLHAIGYTRRFIAQRTLLELLVLLAFSWLVGLALSTLIYSALDLIYFEPKGQTISMTVRALLFTVPLPLTVTFFSLIPALRRLGSLDPVQIIERAPA